MLTYITITGTWDQTSQPVTGTVTFTPSAAVYAAGQPLVSPDYPVQCQIIAGQLKTPAGQPVQLLATGNSGLTVEGRTGFWYWTASIEIGGGASAATDSFSFFLPVSPTTADLYSLANTAAQGGFTNPMTAAGDMIDGGTAGAAQRLPVGSSGQVLTVSGGAPAWQALPAATSGAQGTVQLAGDLGNTASAPEVLSTHLSSPLPVGQGGTGTAAGAPQNDVFAGPSSGGAGAPAFRALVAADLPAGVGGLTPTAVKTANYTANPGDLVLCDVSGGSFTVTAPTGAAGVSWGLKLVKAGAGTTVTFTGAGGWTFNDDGTASGTLVTLNQAKSFTADTALTAWIATSGDVPLTLLDPFRPWQFLIDNYGAKGDGQQALVTTVAGSAVINTTPVGAPGSAPTLSNSGSGGALTAGTYQVKVTYVNRWGETTASASASVAISGTQPLTISSPAAIRDVSGWYAYVTQAGGANYTRQQAAGSPTPIQQSLVLTANPTSSGLNPPGSDTSAAQVFTSTAVDGGKNIMINGGLGSPGTPWIDTIASVQSPTQATLASNGSGQGGNVSQAGCAMVFSSDDRLAIDNCVQAAEAYVAASGNNQVQIIPSNKIYGLGANLFQTTTAGSGLTFNTQFRIPVPYPSGQSAKVEWQITGPGVGGHTQFWVNPGVDLNGATFVSYSIGPTAPDATYGHQSVIGGPTGGVNNNGSNGFCNMVAVVRGVQVIMPGWSNSIGLDLATIAGCRVSAAALAFAPSTSIGGGVDPSNGWQGSSFWLAKIGVGLRPPLAGNNDDCLIESWSAEGLNHGIENDADHLIITRLLTINCDHGIQLVGGGANTHDLTIGQWSIENCNGALITDGSGGHIKCHIVMDGENASLVDINDGGNALYGVFYWSDPFRATSGLANIGIPTVTGAANLEIINGQIIRQVYDAHAYAYTLGTAFQNPWWRHSTLTIAGGTVTGISIGPTSGSLTSLGITSGTFRLPSGWWIDIAGSVKPTTFIAIPD